MVVPAEIYLNDGSGLLWLMLVVLVILAILYVVRRL